MKKISYIILSTIIACVIATGCTQKTEEEPIAGSQTVQESEAIVADAAIQETQGAGEEKTDSDTHASNEDVANYAFSRETFPKMDGSTSMVPLGKAIASVLLGESSDDVADLVNFNKTTQSFRNLKDGYCDILIVGEPNAAVFKEMDEEGFRYELEEIATDALIFVVNKDNPVDNLTTDQIRDIYSGKITNWKQVGGNDAPIAAFQRNEGAGSQALIKKLIMKDTPMTDAPATLVASEMGELMESVKSYDNSANAIGYSVYYYANDMKKAEGLKIISVDGVDPDPESIRSRKYPHLNAYYSVIGATQPKDSPARILYNWLMSKDGQTLIDAEGYVTSQDPDELKTELPGGQIVRTDYTYYRKLAIPENKYTRLSEGEMRILKPGNDYGFIYPYSGSINYVDDENGYTYEAGSLMGFFDEKSRLITDPIFNSIDALDYYDNTAHAYNTVPVWKISRVRSADDLEFSFATMDGKNVCSKWYESIEANEDRIICLTKDYKAFDVYDLEGNKVFSSGKTPQWKTDGDIWSRSVSYGDGWYLITVSDEGYFFVKEGDSTVLGPYSYGMPFDDGYAVAGKPGSTTNMENVGVIDNTGSWIIDPQYEYIERLANGNFICSGGDGRYEILDRTGRLISTVVARYIEIKNFGFAGYDNGLSGQDNEDYLKCYDCEGNIIYEDKSGGWESVGNDGVIYRTMGAGVQLRNIMTGKTIYVEGADQANPFYRLEDTPDAGRIVVRNSYYDGETDYFYCHERAYDNDLNLLFDEKDVMLNIEEDVYTGDWYFGYYVNDSKVCIKDIDFKDVCTLVNYPKIVNEKFIISDEYACECYNKDGERVFSYSLLNSMGD